MVTITNSVNFFRGRIKIRPDWSIVLISYLQTSKMADFRYNFIICSMFLLPFRFISMRSWLTEVFSFLMRSTQISNAVVSKMLLIFRTVRRSKAHCHRNHLQVYVSNKRWFEEIIRKYCVGFGTEHFRMNLDSFQELCRVISPEILALSANSHAYGSKPSISRSLTHTNRFLTPRWKIWAAAISNDCWRASGKYAICRRVICTQTNSRLKSVRKWQFFRGIFSDFWMTRGCTWQRISWDREPKIFGTSSETFGLSSKICGRFSGIFEYERSDSTNPDKNLRPLRQKKLAGVVVMANFSSYTVMIDTFDK